MTACRIASALTLLVGSCAMAQTTQPATMPVAPPMIIPMGPSVGMPAYGPPVTYMQPYAAIPLVPADAEQYASCVIQYDPAIGDTGYPAYSSSSRLDVSMMSGIASSTALTREVLKKVLGSDKLPAASVFTVTATPLGTRYSRVDVVLRKGEVAWPANAADRVLRGVVAQLRSALQESISAANKVNETRLKQATEELERTRKQQAEVAAEVASVRDALSLQQGYDPQYTIQNLKTQKRNAEAEVARNRSQVAAMEAEGQPNDAVSAWETAVKSQETSVAILREQQKGGRASSAEVAEAETKLAQAKTQLAAARQMGGSSRMYSESSRRSMRTQLADAEGRLKSAEDQLARLTEPKMAAKLAEYPKLQQDDSRLRNEVAELTGRLAQLQRTTREQPQITITVLDGLAD